uniref:Uncharacterized protein n=1 Tax=Oryza brachyantha TaxID=4533 RepID=J3NCT8_ORYBR
MDEVPQVTGPQQPTQEAQILLTADPVLYSSFTPFILLANVAAVHDSIRRSGKRMHRMNHADPPMEAGQHQYYQIMTTTIGEYDVLYAAEVFDEMLQ